MNRKLMALLAATTLAAGVPAVASAQDWGVNQRQAQLDQRIDAGVRSGQLTDAEAARLRAEFDSIARLELRYRTNGLSSAERADLDQRFDALSARIRDERRDRQAEGPRRGEWGDIDQRQAQLDQRIDAGLRSGQLTEREAARLRAEFQDLMRLERRYRADGLSSAERADLDQRFDELSAQVRDERRDWQAEGPRSGEWRNIEQRRAQLERRIDVGVRNGQLSPVEAARLRAEFQDILRLERRYSRNGLSPAERAELDRRFDQLSANIREERREGRADRWENLNQRQAQFQQRLYRAVQDRRLNSRQALTLRMEFDNIARLEQRYRQDGLSQAERADLDMRFDRLQANFRASVAASSYGYGYGEAPNLFDYLFGVR